MRQKAFYNISEITTDLYTSGSEWMYETGVEYIGLYHRYVTEEVFTGATWNPQTSVKLIVYEDVTTTKYQYKKLNSINVKYDHVNSHVVVINESDIATGYITRYFLQQINTGTVTECDINTFKRWQQRMVDPNLYVGAFLTWTIAGDIETVRELNIKQIKLIQQTMTNIATILNNPIEYYTDTQYFIPTDINYLDS